MSNVAISGLRVGGKPAAFSLLLYASPPAVFGSFSSPVPSREAVGRR